AARAEKRKTERAEKTLPRFFRRDVRDERVSADEAAGDIRAHVAELRNHDQIEHIKMPGHVPGGVARKNIDDFRDEIEKPEHVEKSEGRVSHRLQRRIIARALEHLPREDNDQKK